MQGPKMKWAIVSQIITHHPFCIDLEAPHIPGGQEGTRRRLCHQYTTQLL